MKIESLNSDVYSYRLCDMTGKQILSGNYAKSGIDTSGLPKGVYLLSLTSEGKTENIKLVKE